MLIRCSRNLRNQLEVIAAANGDCSVNQYCLRLLTDHCLRAQGAHELLPVTPEHG